MAEGEASEEGGKAATKTTDDFKAVSLTLADPAQSFRQGDLPHIQQNTTNFSPRTRI
jgi:hypothetical protein